VAAEWYRKHLIQIREKTGGPEIDVVLLSNDFANRQEADEMKLLNARDQFCKTFCADYSLA
jgi:hypothetical protein